MAKITLEVIADYLLDTYNKISSFVTNQTSGGQKTQIVNSIGTVVATEAVATSAKQDTLLTELQKKADLTETQPVSVVSLPLPSGASTAAKQLADNHNVVVSNIASTPVITGFATAANQTSGNQLVKITDGTDTAQISTDGALKMEDRMLAIAEGAVTGHSLMLKFGRNPDIDGAAEETIWEGGGTYPFQSSAQSLEVLSASGDDTSAGTGARTITLIGLDANYAEQTQVITLNGTSVVAITGTWLRVHRCSVTTAGTGGVNAGLITVRIASAGATLLVIGAGNGQTLMAVYTIPAGITGYMLSYYCSANATPTPPYCDIKLFTRPSTGVLNLKHQQALGPGYFYHKFEAPFKITEKTDIYLNATSSVNNTDVCGGFDIILVTN